MSSPDFADPISALEWSRKRRGETPHDIVPTDEPRELPPVILDGGAEYVWYETVEDADGIPSYVIERRESLLANRDDTE